MPTLQGILNIQKSEIYCDVTLANHKGIYLIIKLLFLTRFKFTANMFIPVHTDLY
jgi:hypothetical protein